MNVPLNWELATVPGAAHSDHQTAPTAARILLADRRQPRSGLRKD